MCHAAYLHVPFCREICSYCDFTRCGYHAGLAEKWLITIQNELVEKLKNAQLQTMYIGGGTPSALSYEQLKALLQALKPYTKHCEEFTIEANVESFTEDKVKLCKAFGVNRISLGVQSLQPSLLTLIHRQHSKEDVERSIHMIKACGINNLSIDLIYGLPTQTLAMWQEDLAYIVTHFPIEHISLYSLTIEENSLFGRTHVEACDSDLEADMYEYAVFFLAKHGFVNYEISNFAKDDKASKHNVQYWKYEDFIGIGMGASGKQNHTRYDNTKNMQTYFTTGATPDRFSLSLEDEKFEHVMMGLRTIYGVSCTTYEEKYHSSLLKDYAKTYEKYHALGLLSYKDQRVIASAQGRLLLNDILVDMLEEMENS